MSKETRANQIFAGPLTLANHDIALYNEGGEAHYIADVFGGFTFI